MAAGPQQPPAVIAPVPPAVLARDGSGRVTVRAVRIEQPLRIDGVLDDDPYKNIVPIEGFIQQEPREGEPATEATLVWVLFDRDNFYISARCRDSDPRRIVANDMRHDGRNITQNDNLSVVLDTFYDRRNGYEFLVNAVGGMMDTQVTDERDLNRDWNTVWLSKNRRDDEGWTVEMAIPFRSLRYRAGGPQVWGINIRRTVRWKNEYSYLSPVPRLQGPRGILKFSSAATLVGLEVPEAALNLDVKPYALSSAKADREVDPGFKADVDANAGFDVKYGLTRGLTADLTYRTDFAQVEDDDQQVNLTRFSLFFPEKREFFLEGQGIFAFGGVETTPRAGSAAPGTTNTPLLFSSRQIGLSDARPVPIDVGGRVTGKAGRYSVGFLEIQTARSQTAGVAPTNFGVFRLKRDILRRSYIGIIGTRRSPSAVSGRTNLAFGMDANFSFFDSLNLVGFYAGTRTPGLAGDDRSYRARFDYDADLFALKVERLAVGKHFNPDVGFLRRSDFIENLAQVRVSRRPSSLASVRKLNFEAGLNYLTNGRRALENRQARGSVRTELHSGDSWSLEYQRNFEDVPEPFEIVGGFVIPVGTYRFPNVLASYVLGPQRRVSGTVSFARGGFYAGDRTDLGYRGRLDLSTRLSIEPGLSVNRVDLPQGRFTAKLFSARSTLTFSPRMFVGALAQYNSTASTLSANVRFRWEYQPGSDLFVVYTDGRDTLQHGFPGPGLGLGLLNRSFAVKLTRLLRF